MPGSGNSVRLVGIRGFWRIEKLASHSSRPLLTQPNPTHTPRVLLADRLAVADLDGDRDLDAISASWTDDKITWYENIGPPQSGDANRDGEFNQLDIVQVLQSAKYLTGEPADWAQGDWNNDDLFNQADIVAALQTGNYLQGPYVALTEPKDQP